MLYEAKKINEERYEKEQNSFEYDDLKNDAE